MGDLHLPARPAGRKRRRRGCLEIRPPPLSPGSAVESGHGCGRDDLTMRIIVEILIVALANSSTLPPMDPLTILLANHSRVLTSNTDRNGTPLIVKIAIVAMQEPINGNQRS